MVDFCFLFDRLLCRPGGRFGRLLVDLGVDFVDFWVDPGVGVGQVLGRPGEAGCRLMVRGCSGGRTPPRPRSKSNFLIGRFVVHAFHLCHPTDELELPDRHD